jgi:ADP-ribose pyrophosphatase
MQTWKTVSRKTILQHSKYLSVESHSVQLPDGRVIEDWPWVIKPDYINVLAQTEQGEFFCFRQTKYAIDGTSLAPVGGYLEPGEDPLIAAKRELLEEMGYDASEWIHLGDFIADGNHGAGRAHLYFARKARFVAKTKSDDLEEQHLLLMNRAELEAALTKGEFKVLAWATTVVLALRFLDRHRASA